MSSEEMKGMLKEAWKEVFGVAEVADDADFFEEGGDSIKAVQLSAWLMQKGIKLDLGKIFSMPLLSQMAESLEETDPMYVPDRLLTKDLIMEKYSEYMGGGKQKAPEKAPQKASEKAESDQICDPANNDQFMKQFQKGAADDQICDPANNNQFMKQFQKGAADDQICDPANNAQFMKQFQKGNDDGQICDPANNAQFMNQFRNGAADDRICDPANNAQFMNQFRNGAADDQICDPANNAQFMGQGMQPGGYPFGGAANLQLPMLQMMISQQQTMLQMMNMMLGMMAQRPAPAPAPFVGNRGPRGPHRRVEKKRPNAAEIEQLMGKYQSKKIDRPVDKPNVIALEKAKVAKPEKSAEEVLEYVLSTVLKGELDKSKDLFEQGLSSLDTVKMVTRCGEYGYSLKMQDIYMHSVFGELVECMKPGE